MKDKNYDQRRFNKIKQKKYIYRYINKKYNQKI